jgi:Tol biopolymer transport system component
MKNGKFELVPKLAVGSQRDNPGGNPFFTTEIYLINPDSDDLNPQRLTDNNFGDAFPMLSPDGKHIVFDSNRLTADPADSMTPADQRFANDWPQPIVNIRWLR